MLIPTTIKMVLEAIATDDGEHLTIDGRDVNQVRLVGNIMRIDRRETKTVYAIEDGTGAIEVTLWLNQGDEELATLSERREKMVPRSYVMAVGQPKHFDGRITLSAYSLRPIENFNEITHHFLETIYVHARAQKDLASPPAWHPPNQPAGTSTTMDVDNDSGLTAIQRKVLDYYTENGTGDEGLNIEFVIQQCSHLFNFTAIDVKNAVNVLTSEGHLYSTLDDDHHKSTDSD